MLAYKSSSTLVLCLPYNLIFKIHYAKSFCAYGPCGAAGMSFPLLLWKMDLSVTISCVQINNRAPRTSFSLLKLIICRLPFEIGSCIGLGKFWVMHVLAQGWSVQLVFSKWWETMYIQFWALLGKLILGIWWGILPHLYCTTTHLLNFSLGYISIWFLTFFKIKNLN